SALRLVVAQRLIRRLCAKCKQPVPASSERAALILRGVPPSTRTLLSQATIHEPVGCPACGGTGYRGRTGIFEVLRVTEAIEDLIIKRSSVPLIRAQARAEGMHSLREAGVQKVALGETSIAEVLEHTVADSEDLTPTSAGMSNHA